MSKASGSALINIVIINIRHRLIPANQSTNIPSEITSGTSDNEHTILWQQQYFNHRNENINKV